MTSERRHWRCSGVFIVNFEHVFTPSSSVFIVDFEKVMFGEVVRYFSSFTRKQKFHHVFLKTDQNSWNFLHLCINSIAIYLKSRAEATIQRCFLRSPSQTQRYSVEQLLCFFPAKFTRNYLFQNLFWLILQACNFIKETQVKVVYFEFYNISQNYFFVECL